MSKKKGKMKAWELIKHLEEGGRIKLVGTGNEDFHDRSDFQYGDYLRKFCTYPDDFEIIKSKKKFKLYRYTFKNVTKAGITVAQSGWTTEDFSQFYVVSTHLLKTEEKEIEVDDGQI